MEDAIEKLLQAKELGADTTPFRIEKTEVWLDIEDDDAEELSICLVRFKLDYNNSTKVYDFKNLSEYDWWFALTRTCETAIAKHLDMTKQKDGRIKAFLTSLESYS